MGAGEEHQPEPTLENVTAPSSISAIAEDLQRTVVQSKDSAIRSARSFQQASSSHIRSLQVLSLLEFYNQFSFYILIRYL